MLIWHSKLMLIWHSENTKKRDQKFWATVHFVSNTFPPISFFFSNYFSSTLCNKDMTPKGFLIFQKNPCSSNKPMFGEKSEFLTLALDLKQIFRKTETNFCYSNIKRFR